MNEQKEILKSRLFDILNELIDSDKIKFSGNLEYYGNKKYIEITITGVKDCSYKNNCMNKPE